ncbi:MAG: hypothetical protein HZA27_00080, partial [Candidatus Omnitrophica bacterium]|nr:hypothetical protein [Candidatus Omnitrophota bacterium]
MQKTFYIETDKLNAFIKQLAQNHTVFTPQLKGPNFTKETDYSYQEFSGAADLIFNPYRCVEPLKSFFTHPKECVSEYFTSQKTVVEVNKTVIFGVKSCDLAGHKVQDFVFLEGVEVDTLYRTRRENIILI